MDGQRPHLVILDEPLVSPVPDSEGPSDSATEIPSPVSGIPKRAPGKPIFTDDYVARQVQMRQQSIAEDLLYAAEMKAYERWMEQDEY